MSTGTTLGKGLASYYEREAAARTDSINTAADTGKRIKTLIESETDFHVESMVVVGGGKMTIVGRLKSERP